MKVKVVSDATAERADFMVCMPWNTPSPFADNLKGVCCECGADVMYRWYAPRKPRRICLQCVTDGLLKVETNK